MADNFCKAVGFLLIFFLVSFFKIPDFIINHDSYLLIIPLVSSYLFFFIALAYIFNIFFQLAFSGYQKYGFLALVLFVITITFIHIIIFELPVFDPYLGAYSWKFPLFVYPLMYAVILVVFIPTAIVFLFKAFDQKRYLGRYLLMSLSFILWAIGMPMQAVSKLYILADLLIVLGFISCFVGVLYHPRTEEVEGSQS